MTSTLATVIEESQDAFYDVECEKLVACKASPLYKKWYDCTPSKIRFGQMQEIVMPWARYPVWNEQTQRWNMVRYAEYLRTHGNRKPGFGVLDILTTGGSITYMNPQSMELSGMKFFCKPLTLQRGNSSCILDGTERALPALSSKSIADMCAKVEFAFYLEVTDADAANLRKQEHQKQEHPSNLGHIQVKCSEHQARKQGNRLAEIGFAERSGLSPPQSEMRSVARQEISSGCLLGGS